MVENNTHFSGPPLEMFRGGGGQKNVRELFVLCPPCLMSRCAPVERSGLNNNRVKEFHHMYKSHVYGSKYMNENRNWYIPRELFWPPPPPINFVHGYHKYHIDIIGQWPQSKNRSLGRTLEILQ